jgi:glycosyltransferase involved in cell wall biosynthesis
MLSDEWAAFAGSRHLDPTVTTDLPSELYTPVANHRLFGGRLLFQWGHWRDVIRASTAIVDLNPRCVSAWLLLLIRKTLRRRTLVWGHLDPRKGPESRTAGLRAAMREMADGSVLYTYQSAQRLRGTASCARVWVAPNSLYPGRFLKTTDESRHVFLYVGRLEPAKKPLLLLEAFAMIAEANPETKLIYVGDGSLRVQLEEAVEARDLVGRVEILGTVKEVAALEALYGRARCSVSPGFVGLSLTQSLGFGVPMVVADAEPHSPEIELARSGAVVFFPCDSVVGLANALESPVLELTLAQRRSLVDYVKARYTAEAMAVGLIDALTARRQSQTTDVKLLSPAL